jgi:hypothetical protein
MAALWSVRLCFDMTVLPSVAVGAFPAMTALRIGNIGRLLPAPSLRASPGLYLARKICSSHQHPLARSRGPEGLGHGLCRRDQALGRSLSILAPSRGPMQLVRRDAQIWLMVMKRRRRWAFSERPGLRSGCA